MISTLLRAPLFAAALLGILPHPAMAELMLNPTRVILERNQRATQVELINNGTVAASYRISLVNRRMGESGEFSSVTEAAEGERFADGMLVFSPRQVTLQPGTAQVVRLMVRKPDALPEGEYRSHLHFEKLPDATDMASSVEPGDAGAARIGVVLKALVGASIPVIVRHGATSATATLAQLTLQPADGDKPRMLGFRIERAGNSSLYGDLTATFIPDNGAPVQVAQARGVAVYVPNARRLAAMPLATRSLLARGTLRLSYREPVDAGGKLLAEAELALP